MLASGHFALADVCPHTVERVILMAFEFKCVQVEFFLTFHTEFLFV